MKLVSKLLVASGIAFSSTAYSLTINGNDSLTIKDSSISSVNAYGQSTLNVETGANRVSITGRDESTINVTGGNISWFYLYDNSTANISAFDELGWLIFSDDAVINFIGSDFSYDSGTFTGTLANGKHFDIWAVKEEDLMTGIFSTSLPDNIRLHSVSVSEPATLALFSLSLAGLFYGRNKKRAT